MNRFLLSLCAVLGLATQPSILAEYSFPTYESSTTTTMPFAGCSHLTGNFIFGKAELKQHTVKEDGWLYGAKGNFDFISPNSIYLGAEVGYKQGDLEGKTHDEALTTESEYSDFWAEGRLGFTLGEFGYAGYFSPYFVAGYEKEKHEFTPPTPLQIKHILTYGYIGCGAISSFSLTDCLSTGLNIKFKWMFNTKCKVNAGPEIEHEGLSSAGSFHWSVEAPLKYMVSQNFFLAVAPFYEYKNYDKHKLACIGKEKSHFHMYGALVQLGAIF
jgi:hypothetical protein